MRTRVLHLLIFLVILPCIKGVEFLQKTDPGCNCAPCKTASSGDYAGTYSLSEDADQQARCSGACYYINAESGVGICMCDPGDVEYTLPESCDGGPLTCEYSKDNTAWGEYETQLAMPAGMSPPYEVVMTFDADTTIGSCHSNCNHATAGNKPGCVANLCTVTYTGTDKLKMHNIKKDNPDL